MTTAVTPPGWRFLGLWILATAAGHGLQGVVAMDVMASTGSLPPSTAGGIFGVFLETFAGIAQWFVLRQRIVGAAWWILASIAGYAMGLGFSWSLADKDFTFLIIGAWVGTLQAAAPWKKVSWVILWVPANIVAQYLLQLVPGIPGSASVGGFVIVLGAGGAVVGVVTGVPLALLLRAQSKPVPPA